MKIMKKINLLIIALFVGFSAYLASCDGEVTDLAAPSITITQGSQTVLPNTAVTIEADIKAAGSIGSIQMKKDGSDYGTAITEGFDTDSTTHLVFTVPAEQVTADFTLQIQVTDLQKTPKTQLSSVINITLDDLIVKGTALKVFSAPGTTSSTDQFASLTTFDTYTWTEATSNVANVDLNYYNGNYTKVTASYPHFISPSITPTTYDINNGNILTGAKTTYFAVLTGADADLFANWETITDDTEINSIAATIDQTNVTWDDSGAAGTIIAFILADGKKGVIKVGNAVDGNSNGTYYDANADYIMFDVIVQKHAPAK